VALTGSFAGLRDAFVDVPARIDGSGATAVNLAEGLGEVVKDTLAELETEQAAELEDLEAEIERRQYAPRTATAMRKRVTDRQKREGRRARTDAVLEGITAIESVYRDALADGVEALNTDRDRLAVNPAEAAAAFDACREARAAFEFNPSEGLLLERLLLHLPTVAGSAPR
jgi:hypothetical protein